MFLQAVSSDPDRKRKIENRIAMNHFGKPQDVANAAVFLCSDAASFINGEIIVVDGGQWLSGRMW